MIRTEKPRAPVPVEPDLDALIEELWREQEGRSAASRRPMRWRLEDKGHDDYRQPDQIIAGLGYVRGNLRLITALENRLKNNMTVEQLEQLLSYMKANIRDNR